jgi:hypothetical protein
MQGDYPAGGRSLARGRPPEGEDKPSQGENPTRGRGQAIAPTLDGRGKPIRSIVGATLVVALGVRWSALGRIERGDNRVNSALATIEPIEVGLYLWNYKTR